MAPKNSSNGHRPAAVPTHNGGGWAFGLMSENVAFAIVFVLSVTVAFVAMGPKIEHPPQRQVQNERGGVKQQDPTLAKDTNTGDGKQVNDENAPTATQASAAQQQTPTAISTTQLPELLGLDPSATVLQTNRPTGATALFEAGEESSTASTDSNAADKKVPQILEAPIAEVCKSLRTLYVTLEGAKTTTALPNAAPRPKATTVAKDGSADDEDDTNADGDDEEPQEKQPEVDSGLVTTILNKHRWIFVRELLGRADAPVAEGTVVEDTQDYHDALIALQMIIEERRLAKSAELGTRFGKLVKGSKPPKNIFDLTPERLVLLPTAIQRFYTEGMYRVNATLRVLRGLHAFEDGLHADHLLGDKQVTLEEVKHAMKLLFLRGISTERDDRIFCAPLLFVTHNSFRPTASVDFPSKSTQDTTATPKEEMISLKGIRSSAGPITANMLVSYAAQQQLVYGASGAATSLSGLHKSRQRADVISDPMWDLQWFDLHYTVKPTPEAAEENCLSLPLVFGGSDGKLHPHAVKCMLIAQLSPANRPKWVTYMKATDIEVRLELSGLRKKWVQDLAESNYSWPEPVVASRSAKLNFVDSIDDNAKVNPTAKLERQLQVLTEVIQRTLAKTVESIEQDMTFFKSQKAGALKDEAQLEEAYGNILSPLERVMRDSSHDSQDGGRYSCDAGYCGSADGIRSPLSERRGEEMSSMDYR